MTSLADQFEAHQGRTSGFDYLRILLAVAVLVWHSYGISLGRDAIDTVLSYNWLAIAIYAILPMFFALSGFLVTSSLYRANSVKTYLTFRGLRIFPALTVEVLLAALVLGPLLTTVSRDTYFSDPQFYGYFTNILGLIRYELPGLFTNNPYPDVVNGSLWTVPYELECYIYLMMLFLAGAFRNRFVILGVFLVLTVVVTQLGFTSSKGLIVALKKLVIEDAMVNPNLQAATQATIEPARILVLSFLAGSVIHVWRNIIPFHAGLAVGAAVIGFALLGHADLYFFSPLFLAYVTVWLGLCTPPKAAFLTWGDYSYGIYLYAFPIQQVMTSLEFVQGNWALHAVISLMVTSIFAVASWHLIEKPCLAFKRYFL